MELTQAELLERGVAMVERYNAAARREGRERAKLATPGRRMFGRKGL